MSERGVEMVTRLYAEGGPFSLPLSPADEEALLDRLFRDFYDEQVKARMPGDYPEGEQVYVGRKGMTQLLAQLRDSWTEWRFELEDVMDAGERVVALIRVVATGGASGLATDRRTAHVWMVRAERLSAIEIFRDRAQALEAVGLAERSEGGSA